LIAALRKAALLTPGISIGYWNARNSPARARSSGDMARRSRPRYVTSPPVTA